MKAPQISREEMMTMIIGQIQSYGLNALAATVSSACNIPLGSVDPSSKLSEYVYQALHTPKSKASKTGDKADKTPESDAESEVEESSALINQLVIDDNVTGKKWRLY
jgi:hypothetical protein